MNLQSWIYVTAKESDNPGSVVDALRTLEGELERRLNAGSFAGYDAVALIEPDDFDEQDVDRDLVESVTHGLLPAIYLNLTYDLDVHQVGDPGIEALLSAAGMTLVLTHPQAAD